MPQMEGSSEEESTPRDWQRFFLGYRERFVDDACITLANGKTVRVQQSPSAKQGGRAKQHAKQRQQQQQALDKASDPALTGSTVWDGAVVLAQYLTAPDSPLWQWRAEQQQQQQAAAASSSTSGGMQGSDAATQQQPGSERATHQPHACTTVLELGAGTGAVSLCLLAASAVDCAILTDIPDMLPHLTANVLHNSQVLDTSRALVRPLRWGDAADVAALREPPPQQRGPTGTGGGLPRQALAQQLSPPPSQPPPQLQPPFELIVGSDLIYYSYTDSTPHSRLLLQALVQVSGPGSLIFLALSLHHNPQEVAAFLRWAEQDWGFEVQRVRHGIPAQFVVPDVRVVRLRLADPQRAAAAAAAAAAGTLRRSPDV